MHAHNLAAVVIRVAFNVLYAKKNYKNMVTKFGLKSEMMKGKNGETSGSSDAF